MILLLLLLLLLIIMIMIVIIITKIIMIIILNENLKTARRQKIENKKKKKKKQLMEVKKIARGQQIDEKTNISKFPALHFSFLFFLNVNDKHSVHHSLVLHIHIISLMMCWQCCNCNKIFGLALFTLTFQYQVFPH